MSSHTTPTWLRPVPNVPKPRLLVVGDAVNPTGLGRSILSLLKPLADRFEIYQLGTNYLGDPHDWPWPVYTARRAQGDKRGIQRLPALVADLEPQLVLIVEDRWWAVRYLEALRSSVLCQHLDVRTVVLTPVDSGPIEPEEISALTCDRLLTCTEYGRQQILAAVTAEHGAQVPWRDVDIVPLGVDVEVFRPLAAERREAQNLARQALLPMLPNRDEAFIVLNANRNQPRKRIDITMLGFRHFLEALPPDEAQHAYLHLHMGLRDKGWDLRSLGNQLGLDDHLILTGGDSLMRFPEDLLVQVHNAADVAVNTSSAEGWGLVAFESAACGVPQVVPDHTGIGELWRDHGIVLPVAMDLLEPGGMTGVHLVDPASLGETLLRLYRDPSWRQERAEAAHRYAKQARFDWTQISRDLGGILDEVLGSGRSAGANPSTYDQRFRAGVAQGASWLT